MQPSAAQVQRWLDMSPTELARAFKKDVAIPTGPKSTLPRSISASAAIQSTPAIKAPAAYSHSLSAMPSFSSRSAGDASSSRMRSVSPSRSERSRDDRYSDRQRERERERERERDRGGRSRDRSPPRRRDERSWSRSRSRSRERRRIDDRRRVSDDRDNDRRRSERRRSRSRSPVRATISASPAVRNDPPRSESLITTDPRLRGLASDRPVPISPTASPAPLPLVHANGTRTSTTTALPASSFSQPKRNYKYSFQDPTSLDCRLPSSTESHTSLIRVIDSHTA